MRAILIGTQLERWKRAELRQSGSETGSGSRRWSGFKDLQKWLGGLAILTAVIAPAQAQTVTVGWAVSPGPNLAGYKLCYGSASGIYTNQTDVGNVTNKTVSGLKNGVTYYFAVKAYNASGLEAPFSNEINYKVPSTNSPPTIVLTAPLNGVSYKAPATINLAASVTANGHTVTKVQFYNGASLLGESAVAPYSFAWSSVLAGSFSLSARLLYDSGNTLSSTPASVTVTNPLPIVALTAPLNGSSYTAPATINLAASVTANGHTVTKVQFYNGASLLGESAVAPYSFRWTNVPAGGFSLSARLLYDASGTATSTSAGITVIGLLAPWQTADVGAVGVAGSAGCNIGTGIFTVSGSGTNIANTTDAFRFAEETASGDCEIRAKVTAVQNTDVWAKAGVMIRETLNANSRFACVEITANNGALFQYRTSTGGSAGAVQITGPTTPYWVRVVRTGTTFTGYISSDGITWAQVGSAQTISMASNVSIGLCVTAHNNTVLCTSTFSNVTAVP